MSPPRNEAAPRTARNGAPGPKTSKHLQPTEKSRTAAAGQRPDGEGVVLDSFPKNKRGEHLVIEESEYKGNELVSIRVWFTIKNGELRPSKKGIALPKRHLPRVIEALSKALKDNGAA